MEAEVLSEHVNKPCPCLNSDFDNEDLIQCDECQIWYHGRCVALSLEEIESLLSSNDKWFCATCLSQTNLPSTNEDDTMSTVTCPRCPPEKRLKTYKGKRGLKIHYARLHKENLSDLEIERVNFSTSHFDLQSFVQSLGDLKRRVRILKRIPKGARMTVALKLSKLLDDCLSNSISAWITLFYFAFNALHIPENSKNLTQSVKNNVSSYDSSQSMIHSDHPPMRKKKTSSLANRIESKISDGDVRGAVKILSSSDTLAEDNEATFTRLKSKHPSPGRPLCFPDAPTPGVACLIVSEKEVLEGVFGFPNGSSAGVDGIRPQHLKDLLSISNGDAGQKLLISLTKFCNLLLSGNVNKDITNVLYGATICALEKKTGGIRPIAVGCTLRRLVSKIACKAVREQVSSYLNPQQLGFATKGGCEGAVHTTRSFLHQNLLTDKIIVKIDFENAFNSVERDVLLNRIKENSPLLYPYLWQCYANPSTLFFGNKRISSEVGLQQGDPAGPMGFSLSIHPIIQELKSELNAWYLDDGTIGGDPNVVLDDFLEIINKSREIGLKVNASKCEVYFCGIENNDIISEFRIIAPGIRVVQNLSLLGAPISENCISEMFTKKFEEISTLLSRIPELKFHISYYLMKHCLFIPKLNYLIRSTPSWNIEAIIKRMDDSIKCTFESLINTKLSDPKWSLCSLPVKYGGMSIRKIADLILPAFLSSVNSSFPLIRTMLNENMDIVDVACYSEGLRHWKNRYGENSIPDCVGVQHEWDEISCKKICEDIVFVSPAEKSLYLASRCKESNGWLQVLPSRVIGTLLDDNTFRISTALRIGGVICAPHRCVCGENVNERAEGMDYHVLRVLDVNLATSALTIPSDVH